MTINVEAIRILVALEIPLVISIDPLGIPEHKIRIGGPQLRTFLKRMECVKCKMKYSFFAIEATKPQYTNNHLNLYGLDTEGKEVRFTSDHIFPKSKGGKGGLSNRNPMCTKCNHEKGDKIEDPDSE